MKQNSNLKLINAASYIETELNKINLNRISNSFEFTLKIIDLLNGHFPKSNSLATTLRFTKSNLFTQRIYLRYFLRKVFF